MLENAIAGSIVFALNFYVLMGGADYGGGVWDLLASGPRATRQRKLIAEAIGPIWEANHVWLILAVVVLFTGFPSAFALITTVLHIPLTLLLIGIVLRGSSFVFRAYGGRADNQRRRWGTVFAISSLITPVWLGITVGAIASGRVSAEGANAWDVFFRPWLGLFPLAVGLFALALFAFLAAVYLITESDDTDLREDFRIRALAAAVLVGVAALGVFLLSDGEAPIIRQRLAGSSWTWPLQIGTAIPALGAFISLLIRRFHLARTCAALQVTFILWGWAFAQYPYLVVPSISISGAAAPGVTLKLLMGTLILGALVLFPSFYYLIRVFKQTAVFGR